jgi:nucleotide-binding universal stress UspA family protein
MLNRIVIPLDRSVLATTAIPFGALLARVTGAPVVVVHVVQEHDDLHLIDFDEYLTNLGDQFPMLAPYTHVVRIGDPAEQILAFAGAAGTVIVMATHGVGGVRRMLLGSVADAVVRQATVPVALIRCQDTSTPTRPTIDRLLVPLDGSELSNRALPTAIDLASRFQAELHLLRVVEPLPTDQTGYLPDAAYLSPATYTELMEDIEAAARDDLHLAAQTCRDAGVEPSEHIIVSTPMDGILRIATSIAANAIVIATHGRSGVRRAVLGSVTTGLVQTCAIPLIVIPVHALAESHVRESGAQDARVGYEVRSVG